MLATDPIIRAQFLALTGMRESRLDVAVHRGTLIFWNGQQRNRRYVVFDAALASVLDMLNAEGIRRQGLVLVLPAMQLLLGNAIVAEEAQPGTGVVALGVGEDVVVLAGTEDQIAATGGLPEHLYPLRWACQIRPAVEAVRRRAKKNDIELPATLAMPPEARPAWARKNPALVYDGQGYLSKWQEGRTDQPVDHASFHTAGARP